MNIVESTGDDVITLSCPQYCCYFILYLSIALQSYLLSCLVLSPFTLPNALHSRFTNISKIMIFSFPCIWLYFPKVFCYYDTLGLWFSLSSLPLSLSSHLISSLNHHLHSFFSMLLLFIFVVFSYISRGCLPWDHLLLLRHSYSADQNWLLLNCFYMVIWQHNKK